MLHYLGATRAAVLYGGLPGWVQAGDEVEAKTYAAQETEDGTGGSLCARVVDRVCVLRCTKEVTGYCVRVKSCGVGNVTQARQGRECYFGMKGHAIHLHGPNANSRSSATSPSQVTTHT